MSSHYLVKRLIERDEWLLLGACMATRISGRSVDKQPSSAENFPYTGLFSLNNIIDGQMAKKKVRPCPQSATYTHNVELVLFIATI